MNLFFVWLDTKLRLICLNTSWVNDPNYDFELGLGWYTHCCPCSITIVLESHLPHLKEFLKHFYLFIIKWNLTLEFLSSWTTHMVPCLCTKGVATPKSPPSECLAPITLISTHWHATQPVKHPTFHWHATQSMCWNLSPSLVVMEQRHVCWSCGVLYMGRR